MARFLAPHPLLWNTFGNMATAIHLDGSFLQMYKGLVPGQSGFRHCHQLNVVGCRLQLPLNLECCNRTMFCRREPVYECKVRSPRWSFSSIVHLNTTRHTLLFQTTVHTDLVMEKKRLEHDAGLDPPFKPDMRDVHIKGKITIGSKRANWETGMLAQNVLAHSCPAAKNS
jgi:hypothetical protein